MLGLFKVAIISKTLLEEYIDAFYRKKINLQNIKNYIVQNKNENDLRFHLNHPSKSNFLSIDVQDILVQVMFI